MSNSTRCAACKYLRRRCCEDCVLAPYFPASDPQRFACIHKIFGASNVSRMLQQLPMEQRGRAADNIAWEAYYRIRDPVYGSVGVITSLQQQIYASQCELAETQAQIVMCTSAQAQQQQQQIQPLEINHYLDQAQPSEQFGLNPNFSAGFDHHPTNFP